MSKATAIVVAYNSAHLLPDVLRPLAPLANAGIVEVTVIDNSSSDNPATSLSDLGYEVSLVSLPENVGFASAINQVIPDIRSEYILLLNPDVEYETPDVEGLIRYLDNNVDVGGVAPLLMTPGVRAANGGKLPTTRAMFFHSSGLAALLSRRWPVLGHYAFIGQSRREPVEVEWVSGGFVLLRTALAEDGRLFSDRWFMYAEDIDLSSFATQVGYRLIILPSLRPVHMIGTSSRESSRRPRTVWAVALRDYYRETLSRGSTARFIWSFVVALGFASRGALSVIVGNRERGATMWAYAWAVVHPSRADLGLIRHAKRPRSVGTRSSIRSPKTGC